MNSIELIEQSPVPFDAKHPEKSISLFFTLKVNGDNLIDGISEPVANLTGA
jgi:hypothetical protein